MLAPTGIKWDMAAEIVIIGYGMAGAVAAITAGDKNADVLILEKQSQDSHCSSSSISAGLFISPSDAGASAEYMEALSRVNEGAEWTDSDIIHVWADYAVQNKHWMENLGGNVKLLYRAAEYPQLPGADSIEVWHYQGSGLRMMQFLYEHVNSRKIKVLYETPAHRLLTNASGEVIGVRAMSTGDGQQKELNIKASKAVILCSGGFEADEEMKLQYLRVYPVYFGGGQANTGDGIRMAQEVGADLWHMSCCSARIIGKFPDFPIAFAIDFAGEGWARRQTPGAGKKAEAGFIIVNKRGKRYTSEQLKSHSGIYEVTAFDTHKLEYPAVPSYFIFDQRRMECGPLCSTRSGPAGPHQLYTWSKDNTAELQQGWIIRGNTIAELAKNAGIPSENLEEAVERWNSYCKEGKDPEFGRSPRQLIPLDSPPFYAVRLFPGGPNTQGGPRRNSKAQVLNPFGKPVPSLYAAGECGSIYGMLYPMAGGNLAECIIFGRIAAENAIQEKAKK